MSAPHPSYLELDRLALGGGTEATRAHVAACVHCRAHLSAVQEPGVVPAWARALEARAPSRRPAWAPRGWSVALLSAGLATLLLVLVVRPGTPGVRAKGLPSTAVYVKREGQVALWDGRQPLVPGDELRLKVVPDGFSFVTVAAPVPGGAPVRLYEGAVAPPEALLPTGWRVDAAPGEEALVVLFSHGPLAPAALAEAVASRPRTTELWTHSLVFEKRSTQGGTQP